jgi:hypothetical protein
MRHIDLPRKTPEKNITTKLFRVPAGGEGF